jgi:hypothetical protein
LRRALVIGLLWLGGCSKPPNGVRLLCAPPECSVSTNVQLVAELLPPASSSLVADETTQLAIDNDHSALTLRMAAPVILSGHATLVDPTNPTMQMPVKGTVVATRPSRIPGRPDVYYQTTIDDAGHYNLVVSPTLPGELYSVRVTPSDPVTAGPAQTTQLAAATNVPLDFQFINAINLPEIHGTVTDAQQYPLMMQLQAIDPATGLTVSTSATSDDAGAFALRLVRTPPATVRLVATPLPSSALPSLLLDVDTTKMVAPTNSLTVNVKLPGVRNAQAMTFHVQGTGPNGAASLIGGATFAFSADVTPTGDTSGVRAIYNATAVSDSDGAVQVMLMPTQADRPYYMTVTPPSSSMFQPYEAMVAVAPAGVGRTFELSRQNDLNGQVLSPSGAPLPQVQVVPMSAVELPSTPSVATATYTEVVTPSPASQNTDSDGRFSLGLNSRPHQDVWDIALIPPATSMLPRLWLLDRNVWAGDLTEMPFKIPRGVTLETTVLDASGNPVTGADLRIYALGTGSACADVGSPPGCETPARLRAEGTTDSQGN